MITCSEVSNLKISSKIRTALLSVALALPYQHTLYAQSDAPFNTPSSRYTVNQDFFKLPEGRTIGATASLDIDPIRNLIWVFDRCGADDCIGSSLEPILKFDMEGNLLAAFGADLFVRPHGTHVDKQGNIWVTDDQGPDGSDPRRDGKGHQVFKFSTDGELLMTLGKPGIAGAGRDVFNQPSDVHVADNGDIFVADGHGGQSNARIVKFNAQGEFIKTWGEKGTGPDQFGTPHALAMDSRGQLFVGDRDNNRVQIFDQEGNPIAQWTQFGRPSGIHIDANDILYVTDSSSGERTNPGWARGIRLGSVLDGVVSAFIPDPDELGSQEGVTADAAGNIYGASTRSMTLRKYGLK